MIKTLLLHCLILSSSSLFAHAFHVGLASVDYEEEKKMMFCTLQLESSDFKHWLEDLNRDFNLESITANKQNSTEWKSFGDFILKHFAAKTNVQAVDFELFDAEIERDGRLFVYLFAVDIQPFESISWRYSLLMGHSMEQQNKMEFKYIRGAKTEVYFAYFFENESAQTLILKKD